MGAVRRPCFPQVVSNQWLSAPGTPRQAYSWELGAPLRSGFWSVTVLDLIKAVSVAQQAKSLPTKHFILLVPSQGQTGNVLTAIPPSSSSLISFLHRFYIKK